MGGSFCPVNRAFSKTYQIPPFFKALQMCISLSVFNQHSPPMRRSPKLAALLPLQAVGADVIRFEKNLLQIGFFAANDMGRQHRTTRRVEQQVMRNGHRMVVAAEFRGSEALGLPSTSDRDKFIAFLKIAQESKVRTGAITNPVRFSGYRMIRELGLSRHGEIYEDIVRWGKRMTDTTITSEKVVYLAGSKLYSDEVLHVFRAFRRTGSANDNDTERHESFEVVLEDWLLQNLNERYVVPEDFTAYKKLKRATSKGIFGYLHVWFHASMGRPVEKDYADLCNLLGVQSYQYVSKIKETMGLALDELVKIAYLSSWDIKPMLSKDGYKLILEAGDELRGVLRRNSPEKAAPERVLPATQLNELEQDAVRRLLAHSVAEDKARRLLTTYGAERVRDCVAYVENMLSQRQRHRIENPAGMIIYALQNDMPLPAEFMKRVSETKSTAKEAELQEEYKKWVDRMIDAEVGAHYPGERLKVKIQEIVADRVAADELYARFSPAQRNGFAQLLLRKEIQDSTPLSTFDEWLAGRKQLEFFER